MCRRPCHCCRRVGDMWAGGLAEDPGPVDRFPWDRSGWEKQKSGEQQDWAGQVPNLGVWWVEQLARWLDGRGPDQSDLLYQLLC